MGITAGHALAICSVALLSTGCAWREQVADSKANFYAVTADKTAFFKFGPQQGKGADMELPKDTLMTVIRPSFGYCKVHLTNGEVGYVASEDIGAAPSTLLAAVTAPLTPPPSEVTSRREEHFNLNSNDPRLAVPAEELPGNSPEPTPLPGTSP